MERQQRSGTRPELALRRELHRRGLRYRLQQRLLPGTRRVSDIVFPRPRVVVDVRGCFWHGCPQHSSVPQANREWWADKIEANRARDLDTDSRLREAGWTVVVVWEHEDVVQAADRVEAAVRWNRSDRPTHRRRAKRSCPDSCSIVTEPVLALRTAAAATSTARDGR
jgi:DNA mismatch endonuclease (patch repair protein)